MRGIRTQIPPFVKGSLALKLPLALKVNELPQKSVGSQFRVRGKLRQGYEIIIEVSEQALDICCFKNYTGANCERKRLSSRECQQVREHA